MQVIVRSTQSDRKFLVKLEGDYIVSYNEVDQEVPNEDPDFKNHYFQIKEILPDRCDGWVIR